eukprot:14613046-Ditylum_brightwellii.AAC.2
MNSGANRHYIQEDAPVTISQKQDPAISVGQPRHAVMTSRYNCDLNIQNLPINVQKGHVLPGLHTLSLSVGKFCDEGYITIFTKDKVHVCTPTPEISKAVKKAEEHSAVNGWRDHSNGL